MAFKVIISDEAKLDLENSYLYYRENASKKVADNFIKDFRKSIKKTIKSKKIKKSRKIKKGI